MKDRFRFRFRAWHKPTKKMFEVHCFVDKEVFENTINGVGASPTNPSNIDDCVLMQCTGLKDKNGTLIYEGDIIAINTHFDFIVSDDYEYKNKSEKGTAYYKVYFDTQKSGFKMVLVSFTKDKPRCVVCDVMAWHQVVGNIYENPELLEGK